ncbi:MAG: tail fiber domain-containing protein [Flavobacteriales bacterium]|nr:tail fiber domain-containing protein [Flavobacteriales bacterium]
MRGDLLGTGNTTGEVFRTDAPTANSTYWRMFRGGTQYGLLYNLTGSNDFNAKVLPSAGNLWLRNSLDNGVRLNAGTLTATIGTYSPSLSSFVGIGPNSGIIGTQGAWARLHLDDGGTVITGCYRPWMKNGIYMSGNNDMMYVGQLFRAGADESDAVVAWGDNAASPAGPDHLRFLFMGDGLEGQEVTRIMGNGNYGIGNFDGAGVQPTERVDVLDGRLRIRQLPGNSAANSLTKVLVVDDSPSPSGERGVIKWRDVATLTGNDCDWTLQGAPGTNSHISTAYAGNAGCPQQQMGVGIGLQTPKNKLDVVHDGTSGIGGFTNDATTSSAHQSDVNKGVGLVGRALTNLVTSFNPVTAGSRTFTGVLGTSGSGAYSYGVEGAATIASGVGPATDVVGVAGSGKAFNNANRVIGVYGAAAGGSNSNTWAFWSDGNTFSLGGATWIPSDENLKTDVHEVVDASAILAQLSPKTYRYNGEAYPFLAFREGRQYGIMAQDLEQVLPEAVREVTRPAEYDQEGQLITPEATFKAVNYDALLPLLIASNKEQQSRIARLEEMVSACCANAMIDAGARNSIGQRPVQQIAEEKNGLLRIVPNPFSEPPTVFYTMDKAGRAQLLASGSDGRGIKVLQEATLEKGEYQFIWDTTSLAPGMYYLSLLVDGETLVQKAVKVDR